MLKEIEIINPNLSDGNSLTLSMREPAQSGFYIESIKGLGPVKANITTINIVNNDGGLFNNARCDTRNIVFKLGVWDTVANVENQRKKLYRYFPIKEQITMKFLSEDGSKRVIQGYIESVEPDIFKKQETFQISVICSKPWFNDALSSSTTFTKDDDYHSINYSGDIDSGVKIQMTCTSAVSGLTIWNNVGNGQYFKIIDTKLKNITGLSDGIVSGDIILLDTIPNEKCITLTRGGTVYNIINAMDRQSVWFKLNNHKRSFKISCTGSMNVTMSGPVLYGGL